MQRNCLNLHVGPPRRQWLKPVYPPKRASPVSTFLASSPPPVQASFPPLSHPYLRIDSGQVERDMAARWTQKPSIQMQKMLGRTELKLMCGVVGMLDENF